MIRRNRSLVLVALPVLATTALGAMVGVTSAAFSAQTANSGNTFQAAASFANIAFVKNVGVATCGATSNTVTVPASGVAAGHTLIVRLSYRSSDVTGVVTATDSKLNVYTADADGSQISVRTMIFSANVAAALAAGDTIRVSFPSASASSVVVDEFSGIAATLRLDAAGANGGTSTTPSTSLTSSNPNDLLYGAVSVGNFAAVTNPAGWVGTSNTIGCGGAPGNMDFGGAYRIVSSAGTYTYNPTLATSQRWAADVVAYKAG